MGKYCAYAATAARRRAEWCKYLCTVHTMRTSEHSAKRHASAEQCATCRLHSALCGALQHYAAHCAALNWAAPTLEIDEDELYCRLTLKPPIRWFMQNGLCLWQTQAAERTAIKTTSENTSNWPSTISDCKICAKLSSADCIFTRSKFLSVV